MLTKKIIIYPRLYIIPCSIKTLSNVKFHSSALPVKGARIREGLNQVILAEKQCLMSKKTSNSSLKKNNYFSIKFVINTYLWSSIFLKYKGLSLHLLVFAVYDIFSNYPLTHLLYPGLAQCVQIALSRIVYLALGVTNCF